MLLVATVGASNLCKAAPSVTKSLLLGDSRKVTTLNVSVGTSGSGGGSGGMLQMLHVKLFDVVG